MRVKKKNLNKMIIKELTNSNNKVREILLKNCKIIKMVIGKKIIIKKMYKRFNKISKCKNTKVLIKIMIFNITQMKNYKKI